jgi:hypothetical protein
MFMKGTWSMNKNLDLEKPVYTASFEGCKAQSKGFHGVSRLATSTDQNRISSQQRHNLRKVGLHLQSQLATYL